LKIETKHGFEQAHARLRQRSSDSLAAFVLSLAMDTGPVGAQVRTFIVGDDVTESVQSVRERIEGLKGASACDHRHAFGREIGIHVNFIVDSIEQWILPHDPSGAFELVEALFEQDAIAMEICGEHDWTVTSAYQRAAALMAKTIDKLPVETVDERVGALIINDGYGLRAALSGILKT